MTTSSGSTVVPGGILVVDDDVRVRELVRVALEGAGYAVVEAADGAEALRLAQVTAPALILLDLDMPVLDGRGFAAQYRAGPGPHAPLVVMSASIDGARAADQLAAVGFLRKPFGIRALVTLVASFVTVSGSAMI